jgi:hypothetical protein
MHVSRGNFETTRLDALYMYVLTVVVTVRV